MTVLVDTPVWSLFFRRPRSRLSAAEEATRRELEELIRAGAAQLIGPVRQEVLSGIREEAQFRLLRERLRAFADPMMEIDDYEEAARCNNLCRAKGIAGSATDFLICAMAARRGWGVFTTDADFKSYASAFPLRLHHPR
jgi:hypothetical protein